MKLFYMIIPYIPKYELTSTILLEQKERLKSIPLIYHKFKHLCNTIITINNLSFKIFNNQTLIKSLNESISTEWYYISYLYHGNGSYSFLYINENYKFNIVNL
jgi:hypothetical protein